MILNQSEIKELNIVTPHLDRVTDGVMSYGNSFYGYDIRLSPEDFYIFNPVFDDEVSDPKRFVRSSLMRKRTLTDSRGTFFIIPGNTYALGVSLERFNMPPDVVGICVGKSTYARCGLIVNTTPLEPGWQGHLTLEFSNSSPSPLTVYANEGIAQVLFLRGEPNTVAYDGKYQGQGHEVTVAKM